MRFAVLIITFIAMIITGFIGMETRYLKAEDLKKYKLDAKEQFSNLENKLDSLYAHQLKTEARNIVRDARREKRTLTNSDRNRLYDISDILRKYGFQLPVTIPPSPNFPQ